MSSPFQYLSCSKFKMSTVECLSLISGQACSLAYVLTSGKQPPNAGMDSDLLGPRLQ